MAVEPLLTIGIPYFDDWARCHVAIQALRADNDLSDCELLLVDNNPTSDQGKLMAGWFPQMGRYVPYTERSGTAPAKNAVFANALGKFVLCIDSHVILPHGTLDRLKAWLREHPDCDDLLSGPILWDDLEGGATEFHPVWRGEMWGIWAGDTRQNPPEEREVWGSGMGAFCARRASWLGFHKDFWGFGGEEGYLPEKYRKAGRKFWHLPWLKWWHSFNRGPAGIPFVNDDYHKCRNYVIGFQELGLDLSPIREHFVDDPSSGSQAQVVMAGVSVGNRTEGARRLKPFHWDRILADPIRNRDPQPEQKAGCGSCGGGKKVPDGVTLENLYESGFNTPSDINEHCPKLREFSSMCRHVTEFGMRKAVSTVALLAGQPDTMISYDNRRDSLTESLEARHGKTQLAFKPGKSLATDIDETDFLFLDTEHNAEHFYNELVRYSPKVRRFIAAHDTNIYGERGDSGGPGMLPALRRFLREQPEWSVVYHTQANHGLTVIGREKADKPKLPSVARMAWNLTKAMASHVANGFKPASEAVANARLDVCATCDQRTDTRCSVCGCFIEAKASLDSSECPLGKWIDTPVPVVLPNIHVGTVITDNYLPQAGTMLAGLNALPCGHRFCVTFGFEKPELQQQYPLVRFASLPRNRVESFGMIQWGTWLDATPWIQDDDLCVISDADMVLQRSWTDSEVQRFLAYDANTIGLAYNAGATDTLDEEAKRIGFSDHTNYPGNWKAMTCFNCGVIVARASVFKRLRSSYEEKAEQFHAGTTHRSRCQWLENWLIQNKLGLTVDILGPEIHSHGHFGLPTECRRDSDGVLRTGEKTVMFRHRV